MAEEASSPLLDRGSGSRSRSPSPNRPSSAGNADRRFELSSESTPLLARRNDDLAYGVCEPRPITPSSRDASPEPSSKKPKRRVRWAILFPIVILVVVLSVLVFAFIAPAVVKEYAQEATVFQPTDISVDSETSDGLRARIRGNLELDASRVQKSSVRNVGRFVTWIATEVETSESEVKVYLPEYGNIHLGTASLPRIKVNIRNGYVNYVDFVANLSTGDVAGIRAVALDWFEGRLGRLRIKGSTTLHLKSGLLSLGVQTVADSVTLEESDFPALPQVNITHVDVHDIDSPGKTGVAADVSLAARIDSPFTVRLPALGFDILVPNCSPNEPFLSIADASTQEFLISPGQSTNMNVSGLVRSLSDELTTICPGRKNSPLDVLVKSYIQGSKTTIYVRGANTPSLHTPQWVVDILKKVTIPLPFTGHSLDNLVKNFTMTNTHFSLPNPLAQPGGPDSQPKVSALMKVVVGVPKQINLQLDIPQIRTNADVFYNGSKLGVLEIPRWQPANSSFVKDSNGAPGLLVEFAFKDAPLRVTDSDVLTEVLQKLIFGSKLVQLHVVAAVDAKLQTTMGQFVIRGIPAEGNVNVKSPLSGAIDQLLPGIESLEIGSTTESSLLVNTMLNFTNPSEHSVTVPFADFAILFNATKVAHVTARNISIVPGLNSGLHVDLLWNPLDSGGSDGVSAGREMLSRFVSGSNTSVTIETHKGTIPALPEIGQALSKLGFQVQIPTMSGPEAPHFIQDATLHLLSLTAEFVLFSPLPKTNIEISSLDATAFYDQNNAVANIDYQLPIEVPPGTSQTPPLPVTLITDGIGYEAVLRALGGSMNMSTVADVGVRIGNYTNYLHFKGRKILTKIRMM